MTDKPSVTGLIFGFLLLLFSMTSKGETHAVFFVGDDTALEGASEAQNDGIAQFLQQAEARGWKLQTYFDEVNPGAYERFVATARLRTSITKWKDSTPNQVPEFAKLIAQLENDLDDSEKYREGDQLILFFRSHGQPRNKNSKAHSIACGKEHCDLAQLQTILEKAQKKNLRVLIVDATCFSGATLDLAGKSVCVVSGSDDINPSYSKTDSRYVDLLKYSSTPLQAFQNLFQRSDLPGVPQISTSSGDCARGILRTFLQSVDKEVLTQDSTCKNCVVQMPENLSSKHFNLLSATKQQEVRKIIRESELIPAVQSFFEPIRKALEVKKQITESERKIIEALNLPGEFVFATLFISDAIQKCRERVQYLRLDPTGNMRRNRKPDYDLRWENCEKAVRQTTADPKIVELVTRHNQLLENLKKAQASPRELDPLARKAYQKANQIYPQLYEICESIRPSQEKEVCESFELWGSAPKINTPRKGGK